LESLIPLWTVQPAHELLSECDANEAYLAASAGRAFALYFPGGGEVELELSQPTGTLVAHWINIDTGEWGPKQKLAAGSRVSLAPPGTQNWAAAIVSDQ
jgi:hypothetical protein